ncbi:TonB-dependent receptor [Gracilinema caldarium]|uniref:TonB-dependent receptor plug n=1 Tax=Gracilinema caldarium (strain ATCC 51460 / DSM 7334 / H1) TaxID=744872 RepID=F8EY38_GRAC1|nr:TonB-dependent receptor [Gracilinema caldarium]AEJ20699.1 TonB-dependent receptor plug [Gracilinema caldarium DSM 7334]
MYLLVALFVLGAASQLQAQSPDLSFVVSANRVSEEQRTVPAQVHVISAQDIAESGAANLVELLKTVPSIATYTALSGPGSEMVTMRGFGENGFGRVLVLVDGRRLNNPDMQNINWNSIALSDIERIEVLDGPASVEYGNNAVGGVINIITKKSVKTAQTLGQVTVGTSQENAVRLSYQAPALWGNLGFTGEHSGSRGYRDRQANQVTNLALQGTYYVSETANISARLTLADLSYQLPGGLSKAQYEANPRQAKNWADEAREYSVSSSIQFDWIPWEQVQTELPLAYTWKQINADMASWTSFTDRVVQTAEARPKVVIQLFAGTLPLRLVGGVDVTTAFLSVEQFSEVQRTTKTNAFDVSQFTVGPYATLRLDLLPNLNWNGGVRYDTALIKAKSEDASVDDSVQHQAFVYDTGLTYRPVEFIKLYAKYGTLFRYPFTDEQAQIYSGFGTFLKDLKPETGYTVEGGLSVQIHPDVQIDGNFYWMELKDEIAYNNMTYQNENMDASRHWGSDIALQAKPISWFSLHLCYSFVQAFFTEGTNKDNKIPLVSPHRLQAELTFMAPFGISFKPSVEYRSEAYQGGDYANVLEKISAYTIYNASLDWTLLKGAQKLVVSGNVKNLLDTTYAPLVFWGSYYPADGRTIYLQVTFSY